MTIDAARVWASDRLVAAGIVAAAREAAWLLEHVLALPAGTVQQHGDTALTREQETALRELVARRAAHYPLQYLLGHMEFAGARLRVTPEALIPRPETEDLVAEVLTLVTDRSAALRCADLGTGSGCIPIALALHLPRSQWWACDISDAALRLAACNAADNDCADRITFCMGDFFEAFASEARFDLITANPPYVADGTTLAPELAHEPQVALYAGHDGLAAYRRIFSELARRLAPGGIFMGEMALEQGPALCTVAAQSGLPTPEIRPDMTGRPRFVIVRQR
jgi:release factor glutamine methyltransferase